MKKIFYFSLLAASALTFSSCTHEEDDIFDKSAAEILNEVSELYSERLTSSEGGWAIEYYPRTIDGFDPNVDNRPRSGALVQYLQQLHTPVCPA